MSKQSDWLDDFPIIKVGGAFVAELPNIHNLATKGRQDLINIKVTYRGGEGFLAIAKIYGGDGSVLVCFGGGSDFYSALLRLDQAIENGSWREDKYSGASA
jgi:hypothetical protein